MTNKELEQAALFYAPRFDEAQEEKREADKAKRREMLARRKPRKILKGILDQ
jgi:hypothetical protein